MEFEQMEKHIDHELSVATTEGGAELALVCVGCNETIEVAAKSLATARFTKHDGNWCLKVENGDGQDLAPGSTVTVEKKNGETRKMTVGEKVGTVDGKFGGTLYAVGEDKD